MTEDEARHLLEQHLADLERQREERLAAALAGPVHIRKRPALKWGNGFYLPPSTAPARTAHRPSAARRPGSTRPGPKPASRNTSRTSPATPASRSAPPPADPRESPP